MGQRELNIVSANSSTALFLGSRILELAKLQQENDRLRQQVVDMMLEVHMLREKETHKFSKPV